MLDQTALLLLIKSFKQGSVTEESFYRQLTEVISKQLQCSRASIWLYDSFELNEIAALDLFDAQHNSHEQGMVIAQRDNPVYFDFLRRSGEIIAHDVHDHPAMTGFLQSYLVPNGIRSLLDVSIRCDGQFVGVFCCEQCDSPRTWRPDQIAFLEQAGKLISFALLPKLHHRFDGLLAESEVVG